MTIIEEIAAKAAELKFDNLSESTVHAAKRAIIDWFAATVPATDSVFARAMIKAMSSETGNGPCEILGVATKTTARTAALINGSMSHLVEFDDIFRDAVYHPGCPVIAAALASAQATGADGRTLITAIVNGYELSTRIGVAVQPEHYRNWHTTGTIGCFGGAAAAATVYGLDAERFAHALATVGTFTAGLQQAFRSDTMSKPLHAGRAAEAGVTAALLAHEGFTGGLDILEGDAGFGVATAAGKTDWTQATKDLFEVFNIEHVTVKNHACCGHSFAAIDAALAIQEQHKINPDDIESIDVKTYETAINVVGGRKVESAFEGKFSLAFCVASALVHGSIRLDAFSEERLHDPKVKALMERLSLAADPALTAAFPGNRSARVEITLKNGQRFEHFQPHRKGDPELPLSDADLKAKFRELTVPTIGADKADVLQNKIERVDATRAGGLSFNWI